MITKITTNNVNVKILNTDKFTRNMLSVNFITSLNEDASYNALLAGVMRLGNMEYKTQSELNKFLDENYGATMSISVSKKGENQIIRFSVTFINDKLALDNSDVSGKMIDFLIGYLTKPLVSGGCFEQEYVDIEKHNLIDQIRSRINNKRRYSLFRCTQEMCADEAYGIDELGIPDVIESISACELLPYYNKLFNEAEVLITGIGTLSEEKVTAFADRLFTAERHGKMNETIFVQSAEDVTEKVEELDVNQSILVMGYRIGSKSYSDRMFAYLLLNSIFGGSPSSFLFMNVREKLSLCYFCSSLIERMKGTMLVYAGISAKNKQMAFDEIERQLQRIKDGDFGDEDISDAVKDITTQFEQITDDLFSLENYYFSCFVGDSALSVEEVIEGIKSVTKQDITEAAKLITLDTVYFLKEKNVQE